MPSEIKSIGSNPNHSNTFAKNSAEPQLSSAHTTDPANENLSTKVLESLVVPPLQEFSPKSSEIIENEKKDSPQKRGWIAWGWMLTDLLKQDYKELSETAKLTIEFVKSEQSSLAKKQLALTVPTALQPILYPVLTGQFLNAIHNGGNQTMVAGAALLIAPIAMNFLQASKNDTSRRLENRIAHAESKVFVSQVHKLSFAALSDSKCQEAVEEARANRGRVRDFTRGLYSSFDSAIAVSGSIVAMALINPYIAGIVAVGVLPMLGLEWRNSALVRKTENKLARYYKKLWPVSWATTDKEIAAEIKIQQKGPWVTKLVTKLGNNIARMQDVLFKSQYTINKIGVAINATTSTAAGGWAIHQASTNAMGAGDVVQFLGSLGVLQFTLGAAAKLYGGLKTDSYFAKRLLTLGAIQPENTPVEKTFTELEIASFRELLRSRSISIIFKDVVVEVPVAGGMKTILQVDDLTIPWGEMIGIVGKKGAGKTTLISTILGTMQPTRGAIFLKLGENEEESSDIFALDDLPLAAWHSHIGYTPQTAYSGLHLSVAESIGLGVSDHDTNPFTPEQAMNICGVSEYLDPNEIEDTTFSYEKIPGARRFSGGELRGIINSRAIISNRKLLILDEPTSGQDSINEKALAENLTRFKGDKLQLIVSHSFGALKYADKIIEVEDGIPRIGTHAELDKKGGIYAKLRQAQRAGLELDSF